MADTSSSIAHLTHNQILARVRDLHWLSTTSMRLILHMTRQMPSYWDNAAKNASRYD